MAEVVYHATLSSDGFIAGCDDDMNWLHGLTPEPNPVVAALVGRIGALLIGHT